MLQSYCIESGFTMVERVGDEYVARYQLDPGGVDLAVAAMTELNGQEVPVVNNVKFTVTGEALGPARYRGELTYGPVRLGVVLRTTNLVAGTPGPTLPFPGPAGESASGGADRTCKRASRTGHLSLEVISGPTEEG